MIKLFIKKIEILDTFKEVFGNHINTYLKLSNENLISQIYEAYNTIGHDNHITQEFQKHITEKEITNLKDRMYCIDFWIIQDYNKALIASHIHHYYDQPILLSLFANIKETLF